jgi:hypothetical protein
MSHPFEQLVEILKEQRDWLLTKLSRTRLPLEGMTEAEMESQNAKLVDKILKAYVEALTASSWVSQREWRFMKEKFIRFMKLFLPEAEIEQDSDKVTPDVNILFGFLKTRLEIDFRNLKYQVRYEAELGTAIAKQKQVLTNLESLQTSVKELYQFIGGEIPDHDLSPYLCTIAVVPSGGSVYIGIWRTGDTRMGISGDLDVRDESAVDVLAKAYIYTYTHRESLE